MAFNIGPIDKDCPCKRDCPERSDICHGKCKRYNEWSDRRKAALDEKNRRTISNDVMSEAKKRSIWRKMRNSRRVSYNKSKES